MTFMFVAQTYTEDEPDEAEELQPHPRGMKYQTINGWETCDVCCDCNADVTEDEPDEAEELPAIEPIHSACS